MKQVLPIVIFSIFLGGLYCPCPTYAQSWDINKPVDMHDGVARVSNIDRTNKVVNMQFYSKPDAGEYKNITCYFDERASFKKYGQEATFRDLKVGDRVVIESALFAKANRSCRELIFAESNSLLVAESSAPSFGSVFAEVVSINRGLKSLSLKFHSMKDKRSFEIYTCFFDQQSYLEKGADEASWAQLREGDWLMADNSRMNSSQRYCGPLKIVPEPKGPAMEEKPQDFGEGTAQVVSVDFPRQGLSLKAYVTGYRGDYEIISCYLDDNSYLEKNGEKAALTDLRDGEWLAFSKSIGDSAQRSCGSLKVIPQPY